MAAGSPTLPHPRTGGPPPDEPDPSVIVILIVVVIWLIYEAVKLLVYTVQNQ